jgi:hypothetical protein
MNSKDVLEKIPENKKNIRVGIYGKGKWALTLREKLESISKDVLVIFDADSKNPRLGLSDLTMIDWAIVASSNETHYEIVSTCLRAGVNVFCEKPLTTSTYEADELYALAQEKNVCLYVDDVFLWRTDFKKLSEGSVHNSDTWWHKAENTKLSGIRLLKDLAYHHIYMLGALSGFSEFSCEVDEYSQELVFSIEVENIGRINMSYSKNSTKSSNNFLGNNFSKPSNDAITLMLEHVLSLRKTPENNKKLVIWVTRVLRAIMTAKSEKIIVVGGGIFGCTAALELAKNGYDVTLCEMKKQLIEGASLMNQLRLHRGYHYPRSDDTVTQCLESEYKYQSYFRPSIDTSVKHYYAIANHDSQVAPEAYEDFMRGHGLDFKRVDNDAVGNVLNMDKIAQIYEVKEYSYDPHILREYLNKRLKQEGVTIKLNTKIDKPEKLLDKFDRCVVATYSSPMFDDLGDMQFEICEKPIVRMPERFGHISLVVLDGPFVSLDPHSADPSLYLIGSVNDAIHYTNVGTKPEIPEELKSYIQEGLVIKPKTTKIDSFKKRFASLYNINENEIEHVGSYFVVRSVEAHREGDDRRKSILQKESSRIYNIFSAKVISAPLMSQQLIKRFETDLLPISPSAKRTAAT